MDKKQANCWFTNLLKCVTILSYEKLVEEESTPEHRTTEKSLPWSRRCEGMCRNRWKMASERRC